MKNDHKGLEALATVTGAVALIGILVLVSSLLAGFFLMLGVGVLHNDWWPMVPSMGYLTAVIVDLTLGTWIALQAAVSRSSKKA